MLKGSMTALITPFKDGEVDYRAYEQLVERQIAAGTHALVPVGTTGESPTLSHEEHCLVVETCLKVAKGKVPVIAGTGSNSTKEAIAFTAHARKAGADAALIVSPYYNKPTQEGLYTHFRAIHNAVSIPIILYNIPGRSVVDISVETMARLSQLPNIIGVKDATADLARVSLQRAACAKDFIQLSGEDATALGFNAQGGQGCISVTANVAPELCAAFQSHMLSGDYDKALVLQDQLMPLHDALFCESNPVPAKYALHKLGLCRQEVRLPLVPLTAAGREKVDTALAASGLV